MASPQHGRDVLSASREDALMGGTGVVTWDIEKGLWDRGYHAIAGIDEAGRGALAGPVVAAAVVVPPYTEIPHVDDSKRLCRAARESLYAQIQSLAAWIGVGMVGAETIDRVNIRQGTLRAMIAALQDASHGLEYLLIDGQERVPLPISQQAFVRGDQTVGSIAAASIIAKVTRDRLMDTMEQQYPGYGFAQHKGYGTIAHLQAIRQRGPSAIHRRTFRGVR
jgi:ribonuclease HII